MPRGRSQAVQLASRASSASISKNGTASAARQSLPPHLSYPPAVPPVPSSPLVAQLRRDFRWASISQFLCSFGYAIGVSDEEGDVEALEADLDSPGADALLPKLVVKLLYALTSDKKINIENLESKFRNQYVLRDPRNNPFGTEPEVTRRWDELELGEKITGLYNCCEWQWTEPSRFRALVDNEEDAVYWRIEPCGWDKTGNTYWLFDDNRLWVQHPDPNPPTPPKPIPEPAVETASKTTHANGRGRKGKGKGTIARATDQSSKRKQSNNIGQKAIPKLEDDSDLSELEEEIPESARRLRKRPRTSTGKPPTVTRSGRVSKTVQDSPSMISWTSSLVKRIKLSHPTDGGTPVPNLSTRSTRTSRRSGVIEDQWEPIPEEWLQPPAVNSATTKNRQRGPKKVKVTQNRRDSDSSELSDLSSSEELGMSDAGIESDLTSISSSAVSDLGDPPEAAAQNGTMANGTAEPAENEEQSMEMKNTRFTADDAQIQVNHDVPVDPSLSKRPSTDHSPVTMGANSPITNAHVLPNPEQCVPDIVIPTLADADAVTMEPVAGDVPPDNLAWADRPQGDLQIGLQDPIMDKVAIKKHDRSTPPHASTSEFTPAVAVPVVVVDGASVSEVPPDIASTQTPAVSRLDEQPVDGNQPKGPEAMEESSQSPVEKAAERESKTVLEELSVEAKEFVEEEEDDPRDEVRAAIKKSCNLNYLEWELVCASRHDWEIFPKQFETSRNVDEKAFYRHLIDNILPGVLAAYRDKEVRRAKEDAVRNRKRSSRLIMHELEKEARRKEEETARLMEERMQRVRDEEARQKAEEAERISKEREREDRLREREERIREREERLRYKELEPSRPKMESHRSPRITIPAYANQRSPVLQKAMPQTANISIGSLLAPPARSEADTPASPSLQSSVITGEVKEMLSKSEAAIIHNIGDAYTATADLQQDVQQNDNTTKNIM